MAEARFRDPGSSREADWRAIILLGRNTASYKFAFGRSLLEFAGRGQDVVTLEELADPFSRHLCSHLAEVDRQAISASSRFLDACRAYNRGEMAHDELISRTVELGFVNVVDAFPMVNSSVVGHRFYVDERSGGLNRIRLTDETLALAAGSQASNLPEEIEARWRLVEAAWGLSLPRHLLTIGYDGATESLVAESGRTRRRPVTAVRPALNGYQRGRCFYCGAELAVAADAARVDVDHFLPWSLGATGFPLNLDGVWNLVLACADCNRGEGGKSARLPALRYLEALHARNEHFIASHHPLRETLIAQTGESEAARVRFLQAAYDEAATLVIGRWESRG